MKILVVVDVQKDFIDGALYNKEAIKRIPNIIKEIKNTDAKYVFFTQDTHFETSYMNTMEGKKLSTPHCIFGTEGWYIDSKVLDAVPARTTSTSIQKHTFGYSNWKEEFEHVIKDFDKITSGQLEIEVIGYCTDICVISNVMILKATFPNATIQVKESCCAGVDKERHNNALKAMECCHIDII